jgi:hypothetical protein
MSKLAKTNTTNAELAHIRAGSAAQCTAVFVSHRKFLFLLKLYDV